MKASQLIVRMQSLIELHGDCDVCVFDSDEEELKPVPVYITMGEDEEGKIQDFTLCDKETFLAFAD